MRTRFIVGPLLVLAVLGMVLADRMIWPVTRPVVSLLLLLLGVMGWLELAGMAGFGRRGKGRRDTVLTTFGVVAVVYFHAVAWWFRVADGPTPGQEHAAVEAGIFCLVLVAFALAVFRREPVRAYRTVLETVLGVLVFGFLFSFCIRVYLHGDSGQELALVLFFGVKGTDIAAYLVGSWIGRHRFLAVSPKKSIEGCLGALVWGALWFGTAPLYWPVGLFPWWQGILFGIILAVVAQIGDFSESLLKREYQTKDSRRLLPEFGGVLDMIDSLTFTGYLYWCMV